MAAFGNRHKKRNNTIHFANGMTLWVLGANNKTNLQRRSIRWLVADETWRYKNGHMAEAEARVTAFGWLGKCLFMSQGGEEDDDTHRKHETTDMREWTFACPHCHQRQPFKWEQVEWSKDARDDDGEWNFARVRETASLTCEGCGHSFDDSDRTRRQRPADRRTSAPCAREAGALRIPQGHRIHRQPAHDHHGQGAAPHPAAAGRGTSQRRFGVKGLILNF